MDLRFDLKAAKGVSSLNPERISTLIWRAVAGKGIAAALA
jgi:hypothetical protein